MSRRDECILLTLIGILLVAIFVAPFAGTSAISAVAALVRAF